MPTIEPLSVRRVSTTLRAFGLRCICRQSPRGRVFTCRMIRQGAVLVLGGPRPMTPIAIAACSRGEPATMCRRSCVAGSALDGDARITLIAQRVGRTDRAASRQTIATGDRRRTF